MIVLIILFNFIFSTNIYNNNSTYINENNLNSNLTHRNKFFYNMNLELNENKNNSFSFYLDPAYQNCKINFSYIFKKIVDNYYFKLDIEYNKINIKSINDHTGISDLNRMINLKLKNPGEYIFKINYKGRVNIFKSIIILDNCYSISLPLTKKDYYGLHNNFLNIQESLIKDIYSIENSRLNEKFIEKNQENTEKYIKIFTLIETIIVLLFSCGQIFYLIKIIDNKRII